MLVTSLLNYRNYKPNVYDSAHMIENLTQIRHAQPAAAEPVYCHKVGGDFQTCLTGGYARLRLYTVAEPSRVIECEPL